MVKSSSLLRQRKSEFAQKIVDIQYSRQPEIWKPYGHPGRLKSHRDSEYHLDYLAEAIDADDPLLFSEYLAWVKVLFASLGFPDHVLPVTIDCIRQVVSSELDEEERDTALRILDVGLVELERAAFTLPSFLSGDQLLDDLARRYLDALLRADRHSASEMIIHAVETGVDIREIYLHVFERTQHEIGRLWQMNQINVAQEHYCTAATQMVMSQLYPYIFSSEQKGRHVVVACVGGELHELGARMVADFFEMNGWDSYFLGANTPPQSVLQILKDNQAELLAISATMTFNLTKVTDLIRLLRDDATLSTRVLVGGYPFNLSPDLWSKVGANGYACDALGAIIEADRIFAE